MPESGFAGFSTARVFNGRALVRIRTDGIFGCGEKRKPDENEIPRIRIPAKTRGPPPRPRISAVRTRTAISEARAPQAGGAGERESARIRLSAA